MCASVVKGNLQNRLWILPCSLSPDRLFPRNAEAFLASKTRQLLETLLALSSLDHLSGQTGTRRECISLLAFALPGGIQDL